MRGSSRLAAVLMVVLILSMGMGVAHSQEAEAATTPAARRCPTFRPIPLSSIRTMAAPSMWAQTWAFL